MESAETLGLLNAAKVGKANREQHDLCHSVSFEKKLVGPVTGR